ncbi:LysR family transcriptional regulator [uncultured Roseibium sp.]|uniref:LysR family transcriptional regulator n=1 Tax=uncultured Roseibium sp. TaxID=1936171 RepID=UPI002615CEFB|nr:LysR family transcriptional regulator [uncultured Roseibium sp.]
MDILLARTYLEVIAAGNFVNAARRLNITQSAVSLRIRKLEDLLGQPVFMRTRSGTSLTPAGRQFERFALTLVKVWEEARHQVSVPAGYSERLVIGGQYSLLPGLTMRWFGRLEQRLPDVAFRIEAGMADRLIRQMVEGVLDIAIMYRPQLRPGLTVEQILGGDLVMVSADPDFGPELDERYIFMDWGEEFVAAHNAAFPDQDIPRSSFATGALSLNFIINSHKAAYFPARLVRDYLETGQLHLVNGAPSFSNPVFVVYQSDLDPALRTAALEELYAVAKLADAATQDVLRELDEG